MDSSTMGAQSTIWDQHTLVIILCWSLVAAGTFYFINLTNKSLCFFQLPICRRSKPPRIVSPGREVESHKTGTGALVAVPLAEAISSEQSVPRTLLPVELVERVADHLFELKAPTVDSTGDASITSSKPAWQDVQGFMDASPDLHNMGYVRWLRVITVKSADDWTILSQHLPLIREIICYDGTLLGTDSHRLSQLPRLYAATIDVHGDVRHGNSDRFTYRDVIVALPPGLKRLEIKRAHGPDIRVIATVKKCCPQLEELRLGRCTMFNCIPACDFWMSFPHDHDAYISDAGTDPYAHSLGHELAPLKNLRILRMGLYLVPFDIVLAHRLYHRRGRTAPNIIDWQMAIPLSELPPDPFIEDLSHVDPATTDQLVSVLHEPDSEPGANFDCPQCIEATAEIGRIAEMNANEILHGYVPSLTHLQWMGWLTPGHLGIHSFELASKSDT